MNENAEQIANFLQNDRNIGKVYYAEELRNGGGHIVSFELKEDNFKEAEAFYDN